MVAALGLILLALLLMIPFFLTRPELTLLSRRLVLGRDEGVVAVCSFCWCRNSKSRLAKLREHSGQVNGFSLVCDRS